MYVAPPLLTDTRYNIVTYDSTSGDTKINGINLFTYVSQLHLFVSLMDPLDHMCTKVGNNMAKIRAQRGSISSSNTVGPLLR